MFMTVLSQALTNISCAVFAAIMLVRADQGLGDKLEFRALRGGIWAFLCYAVLDFLWYIILLFISFGWRLPIGVVYVTGIGDYVGVALTCYAWFLFCERHFHIRWSDTRQFFWATLVPLAVVLALVCTTPATGLVFSLGPELYDTHGPLYLLVTVLDASYALAVVVQALWRLPRERSAIRRRGYWIFVMSAIPPVIAATVTALYPASSTLLWGLFIMVFIVYVHLQDAQVYIDALTRLNNRRRTEEYLEAKVAASAEEPFTVCIVDVDRFKLVNDTLGHVAGDRALVLVADALRTFGATSKSYIARWGGDEFVVVVDGITSGAGEDVRARLNSELAHLVDASDFAMSLNVSVGVVTCDDPHAKPRGLVQEADELLYQQKKVVHAGAKAADKDGRR